MERILQSTSIHALIALSRTGDPTRDASSGISVWSVGDSIVDARSTGQYRLLAMLATLLLFSIIILAAATPLHALADEIENGEEYGGSEVAEGLGSTAASLGAVLIAGFVAFREAFPRLMRRGIRLPRSLYRRVLELHAGSSLVLGSMGLAHGYMLRAYAGPVEYALASVIAFTMVTGVILWFSRGSVRRAARFIHVQRLLSAIIVVLLLVHVATVGD